MTWKGRRRRPAWIGPEPTPGQPVKRPRPYIFVTWLTWILAGDAWCLWALWFKSHYKWSRGDDDDFDSAKYTSDHRAVAQQAIAALMEDGYQVWVEKQNALKVKGVNADLSGIPDVVGLKGNRGRVVDAKSGKKRNADWWQVQIYKMIAPLDKLSNLRGLKDITGAVQYRDRQVEVGELTPTARKQIIDLIRVAAGNDEPARVPSRHECRYCAITAADCPDRIEDDGDDDDAAPADTGDW